ncbi:Phosphatidylinositol 3,4,5-trisphosphate 3-phosphatase and dual-specificity protein phosphatase PTEN [Strongyloides ratti]|uniref:phosphatidylinositol-3,4,5-trisphosphate 3-phosphatase n=1 Tax=Strongyloides ratti TaxID=34506 RepID=A0A090MND0_STRRB|nr:Phosphatidylinositol 3,4,5-trisphosphate 3-phosphatase and dual-specificity protein phosphatase PTEN [Strongyloides ratti]CEF59581.1 Phosphatidylinositol 3,4,5-trisphosphate 3-phosphatase and dual-specificity protein phosphatase PTEN [Strongyloides ratti]
MSSTKEVVTSTDYILLFSSLLDIKLLSYLSNKKMININDLKSSSHSKVTSNGITTLTNSSSIDLFNICHTNCISESFSPNTLNQNTIKEESFSMNDDTLTTKKNFLSNKEYLLTFNDSNKELKDSGSYLQYYIDSNKFAKTNSATIMGTQSSGKIYNPLRKIVSQNRRRYICDDFNLDLTYITDRIIAMGYPAEHSEKFYRNSMEDTKNFLEQYHSKHYLVFNLRGQFRYDEKNFDNRVRIFQMTDHHPPKLELMAPFCREVHKYLQEDPRNIVAVHCKAGKGRTGVMICAYLVYINFYESPRKIMEYYSVIRTMNNKGVTIPSQRRYVYYFHHLRQKNLNYFPLRIELVGIYIERPPRSDTKFTKGLLKIRVADRDIEVFCGKGFSFKGKAADEEEEMWKTYPSSIGDDQYNPFNPQDGNDIISRRCYGWTVNKSGKRIFLEGDIRIDLFCEPQVKIIGYKKDDIKIGHIWFNTLFTCPGYCGGNYIHGDEYYTYPNNKSDLVKEVLKPINKNNLDKDIEHKSFSTPSIPNSNNFIENVDDKNNNSDNIDNEFGKVTSKIGISLNKVKQKFSKKNENIPSLTSKNNKLKYGRKSLPETSTEDKNIIKYNDDIEYKKILEVEKPPGLDSHCPEESLSLIYNGNRKAPRNYIDKMLKEAYEKNLIVDKYNERRLSILTDGKLIPKSIEGEPNGDGPYCLKRKKDEHVQIYNVIEVDTAYKNKAIDDGFKLIVVTRCIDTENKEEVDMADQFINETYRKQRERDIRKNNKRKSSYSVNSNNVYGVYDENFEKNKFDDQIFKDDPRLDDEYHRRYFFRQRCDSLSRHPEVHYHCPLKKYISKECVNGKCDVKSKVDSNEISKNYITSNDIKNDKNEEKNGDINKTSKIKSICDERSNIFYDDYDEEWSEFENNDNLITQKSGRTRTMIPATALEQFGTSKPTFSSPSVTPRTSGSYETDDQNIKESINTIKKNYEKISLSKKSTSSIKSSVTSHSVHEDINSSESSWATSSSCSSSNSFLDNSYDPRSVRSYEEYVEGDVTPNYIVEED